jgi:hypothetical protein
MRAPIHALLALCSLLAGACATPASIPPGVVVGEELRPRSVVAFATVDADPSAYFERVLLVEATVTAVCKKVGCWMQIEDQGRRAMVRWETGCGGKFAFPAEAVGRRVLVQGTFYPKSISAEDAEHLAAESGGDLVVDREGYEFNASAVLLIEPGS